MVEEKETGTRITVHRWRCPKCSKEIVGISRKHVDWNIEQHLFRHMLLEEKKGEKDERKKKDRQANKHKRKG